MHIFIVDLACHPLPARRHLPRASQDGAQMSAAPWRSGSLLPRTVLPIGTIPDEIWRAISATRVH
jgi:hypothetical protein